MRTGLRRLFRALKFPGSARYWETRYASGGTSGEGSYGELAAFKAEILNEFVAANNIASVIEFGCGDGNQLALARYPRYSGFDVSPQAVSLCRKRFAADPSKLFGLMDDYRGEKADLGLSLDVVYHLVEDAVGVHAPALLRLLEARGRLLLKLRFIRRNGPSRATSRLHRLGRRARARFCPHQDRPESVSDRAATR